MALSDIYQKASLVQIPSGYKSGTLYSVVPNTADGDFTVTGDPEGEATRVNKDGLIESVAADVPRLDYPLLDGVVQPDPFLLLEPQRTNIYTYSQDLSQDTTLINTSVDEDSITSPDGALTGNKLTQTSGAYLRKTLTSLSGTYAWSFFAKKGDLRYLNARSLFVLNGTTPANGNTIIDLDTNTIAYKGTNVTSASIQQYPNDWVKVEIVATDNATGSGDFVDFFFTDNVSGGYNSAGVAGNGYIWGVQFESASYATSYIPNLSSGSTTRTVDTCVDAGNNTIISSLDGSVFVDLKVTNDSNLKQINLFDGGNNRITISVQFSILSISIVSNVGGTIQTLYSWDVDINTNDRHKIVIRYKENDSKLYYNGLLQTPTTYTGSWFNDGVLDNFSFDKSGAFSFYGKIHQAMVFSEALSDIELETITSYTSFNQMAKALLYTIE